MAVNIFCFHPFSEHPNQRTSDPRAEPQEQAHRDHLQQLDEASKEREA